MQQQQEQKSGCGTIFLVIFLSLFAFAMCDKLSSPPKPACAYGVEFC